VNFGGDPKNSFFLRKLCKVILTKSSIMLEQVSTAMENLRMRFG